MKIKLIIYSCLMLYFTIGFVGSINAENTATMSENNHVREWFERNAKLLNEQCPIVVDEITTFQQVLFSGKTLMIKTLIKNDYIDEIDYVEFKQMKCENYSKLLDKQFVEFIKDSGYVIQYVVFDERDRVKTKVDIRGEDILEYY